jgi:hypothetical protein
LRGYYLVGKKGLVEFLLNAWWIRLGKNKTFIKFCFAGFPGVAINLSYIFHHTFIKPLKYSIMHIIYIGLFQAKKGACSLIFNPKMYAVEQKNHPALSMA